MYNKGLEDHVTHVLQTLLILRQHRLNAKVSKCALFQSRVEYLGHIVSVEGLSPNPAKLQAMRHWKVPESVIDIRIFLGLA